MGEPICSSESITVWIEARFQALKRSDWGAHYSGERSYQAIHLEEPQKENHPYSYADEYYTAYCENLPFVKLVFKVVVFVVFFTALAAKFWPALHATHNWHENYPKKYCKHRNSENFDNCASSSQEIRATELVDGFQIL